LSDAMCIQDLSHQ